MTLLCKALWSDNDKGGKPHRHIISTSQFMHFHVYCLNPLTYILTARNDVFKILRQLGTNKII